MLRPVIRAKFFVLFLALAHLSFSQTQWPHTLLWRISGNGLQKPSYLYGTMHLQDKRLFQFGDSLYHALESTDGYAMEINPAEFMDSVMTSTLRKEEDKVLQTKKVVLDRKKLSRSADSLLRSIGIKGNVATKKDLKKLRDQRMVKLLQQGEMPTIMDAYLYGLAHRLGKWTGGIEDVNDQLNLSDELGGELEPEAVLQPEEAYTHSIEQMTKVYLSQDLNAIDRFSNGAYNAKDKDEMLIHRNLKMAFRMDSLSQQRSMFFTVGAAHLPGDSGVITELRHRGFRVEPVFSSATRFAGDYAVNLPPAKWETIEGHENAYTVHMPGQPMDYNVLGNLVKMKMYFDLTTMTFYLAGKVSGPNVSAAMLDDMLKGAVQSMAGKTLPVKTTVIESGQLKGKEAAVQNDAGTYRLRLLLQNKTVFMLMAGALKKKAINSADVERFFGSFVPHETKEAEQNWTALTLADKGVSVKFPAAFSRNEAIDKKLAETGTWQAESYNAVDPKTGSFYMLQVRETSGDYFLDGDSSYFELVKKDYRARVDSFLRAEKTTVQSYPALYLDGYESKAKAVYKTLTVTRGNRVYLLIAGLSKDSATSDAETFLSSLSLLPSVASPATLQTIDGFAVNAPGNIRKGTSDTAEQRKQRTAFYYSTDEKTAARYYVYKSVFSPNYWINSDSAFFNGKAAQHIGENDSLLEKKWVQNGAAKGLDLLVQAAGFNGLKKWRLFVNGDTLYTLYSIVPRQDTAEKVYRDFFAGFRILHSAPPTIYTNKTKLLLQNLQSRDSATFAGAAGYLESAPFGKEDLPLLQEALLKTYGDGDAYESVSGKLVRIIGKLADSTTVSFVKKSYTAFRDNNAPLQYQLLTLLAKTKTASSYSSLSDLLLNNTPVRGDASRLRYALYDSLPLTATLFPELLQKASDSLLGYSVVNIANRLADSNLLQQSEFLAHEEKILAGANTSLQAVNKKQAESWVLGSWIGALQRLNTTAANTLLRKAVNVKEVYLKQQAVVALLKNGLAVPAEEMAKVAADKEQRISFYEDLKKIGKRSLFPALYATQRSLAESEIYNLFAEDYGNVSPVFLGVKNAVYKGKKAFFYLFKIRMASGDEDRRHSFLAVAGPYEVAAKETLTNTEAGGYYSDEELTPLNLDRLFKAYLSQQEKPAGK